MRRPRRKTLVIGCLAAAAVAVTLAAPAVHWPVYGWVKHEPFYDGMPASYWRSEIARRYVFVIGRGSSHRMDYYVCIWYTPWEQLWNRVGLYPSASAGGPRLSVLNPTPDAVPVLTVLIADPEPKVRAAAVQALGFLGKEAGVLNSDLESLANDSGKVSGETTVGEVAQTAIRRISMSRP